MSPLCYEIEQLCANLVLRPLNVAYLSNVFETLDTLYTFIFVASKWRSNIVISDAEQ